MKINSLFVYGTLAPSRPNEHILKKLDGSWIEGSVKGKLYQEGWGAEMGYPAIIIDKNGEDVEGFLFSSDKLSAYLDVLDQFEGEAYKRVTVEVKLKDDTKTDAYIYSLKEQEKNA